MQHHRPIIISGIDSASRAGCGHPAWQRPLERIHNDPPAVHLLVISRGEPEGNRAEVREHGLTYPVVFQRQ
jgi:hypothetical protein